MVRKRGDTSPTERHTDAGFVRLSGGGRSGSLYRLRHLRGCLQFGALKLNQGVSQVDEAVCMGCGVCVNHCPQSGIELRREESKGIPFEIFELMKLQQD